jgi:hypothetical protein
MQYYLKFLNCFKKRSNTWLGLYGHQNVLTFLWSRNCCARLGLFFMQSLVHASVSLGDGQLSLFVTVRIMLHIRRRISDIRRQVMCSRMLQLML